MADKKISELTAITGADTAADDYFIVVDTSGSATKKISRAELNNAIEQDVLSSIEITDITNDVNIEGTVTADGLTVDVTSTVGQTLHNSTGASVYTRYQNNSGNDNYIGYTGNSFEVFPNNTKALTVASGGDVSLYDSSGVSQGFFWDASTQRLGLGSTSPSTLLHVVSSSNPTIKVESDNVSTGATIQVDGGSSNDSFLALLSSGTSTYALFRDGSQSDDLRLYSYTDTAGATDILRYSINGSLRFSTNNAERMRIDSSGNVKINSGVLQLSSEGVASGIINAEEGLFFNADSNGTGGGGFEGQIIFGSGRSTTSGGTEYMRINNSGNVGIGTSSPITFANKNLEVNGTGDSSYNLSIGGTHTAYFYTTASATSFGSKTNIPLVFNTNNTERMRILSGGDIAFGNTAANLVSNTSTQGGGGYVASDKHFEFATNSNRSAVEIGKNNANDGSLVTFRKQGTTVGSIGTRASYLKVGTGDSGLLFNSGGNSILPENIDGGAGNDGGLDLGVAGARFKDLYLSGGVYLGGTGASNLLDDYEEGTWTPEYGGTISNPTVTHDIQSGKYTKVGNLVTVAFQIGTDAATGGSGSLVVRGLPFSVDTTVYFRVVGYSFTGSNSTYNSDRPDIGFCEGATSRLRFWKADTTNVDCSFLNNPTNDNRIFAVVSYYTS